MYNVSVMVSHLCDQSSMTILTEVYYYPRTSTHECCVHLLVYQTNSILALILAHTYGNPEVQISNSVTVSGYTDPAVEGNTVTIHCPPGLVLNGINSSTCMENGEWEPTPYEIYCSGIPGLFHNLSYLYLIV